MDELWAYDTSTCYNISVLESSSICFLYIQTDEETKQLAMNVVVNHLASSQSLQIEASPWRTVSPDQDCIIYW